MHTPSSNQHACSKHAHQFCKHTHRCWRRASLPELNQCESPERPLCSLHQHPRLRRVSQGPHRAPVPAPTRRAASRPRRTSYAPARRAWPRHAHRGGRRQGSRIHSAATSSGVTKSTSHAPTPTTGDSCAAQATAASTRRLPAWVHTTAHSHTPGPCEARPGATASRRG